MTDLALVVEIEEEDCRDAEVIVYEDGEAVAFVNCSASTIIDEMVAGVVRKTGSEIADWLKTARSEVGREPLASPPNLSVG